MGEKLVRYTLLKKYLDNEKGRNLDDIYSNARNRAIELGSIIQLPLLGNGSYRGIYKYRKNKCLKLGLADSVNYMNKNELDLYMYCKENKPELEKLLCPIIATYEFINILPICKTDIFISDYEIKKIIEIFDRNDIELWDVDGAKQFGKYKGRTVLLDYADWNFKEDSIEGKRRFHKQLEELQMSGKIN